MTYVKSLLLTLGLTFVSSIALAQEVPIQNFSTDNKLLSEVKTRMVLDNGLVIHIWEWNEKKDNKSSLKIKLLKAVIQRYNRDLIQNKTHIE